MKRFWTLALAGLLLLGPGLSVTPAQAIEAEELRAKLVETLSIYRANTATGAGDFYRYQDLKVEAKGDDFRVTVIGLAMLADPVEDVLASAGTVGFTMTPEGDSGGDDLFRISDLDLPSAMTVTRAGVPDLEIKLGAARLDALWSFAYLTYLNMDALIEDVVLWSPGEKTSVTLPRITGEVRSIQKDEGVYDMTFDARVSGLEATGEESELRTSELDFLMEVADYDLAALSERYRKIARSAITASSPAEHMQGVFSMFLGPESWLGSGSGMRMDARELDFADLASGKTIKLESLGLGFGLSDLDQPLARANLLVEQRGWQQNGVAATGNPLEIELLPQQSVLKVTLEKLPFHQIMAEFVAALGDPETAQQVLDPQPEPPEQLGTVMDPMAEKIRQAFLQAGTTINIANSNFQSQAVELELGGLLAVDPAAAFGVTGSMAAALFGLDRLIELAQAAIGDPDPATRSGALQAVGVLGILQAYAARGAADDGRPVDRFEVLIEPSGAITVNGQPVVPME